MRHALRALDQGNNQARRIYEKLGFENLRLARPGSSASGKREKEGRAGS